MLFKNTSSYITILLCFFFLFRIVFNNFFIIPVNIENSRLKRARVIPTGPPITTANYEIEMLPLIRDKTIKDLSKYQKKQIIYQGFYLLILFL